MRIRRCRRGCSSSRCWAIDPGSASSNGIVWTFCFPTLPPRPGGARRKGAYISKFGPKRVRSIGIYPGDASSALSKQTVTARRLLQGQSFDGKEVFGGCIQFRRALGVFRMKMEYLRVSRAGLAVFLLALGLGTRLCGESALETPPNAFQHIPKEYLLEASNPPEFWVSTIDGVTGFLQARVHKGEVVVIGTSAGGRPIRAVLYGHARNGKGTTTFSGAVGAGTMRAYFGPDFDKKVYVAMASVHGGEFEGIVGLVNLLSVLETGVDLRGRPWPRIVAAAGRIDRLIVIPIVNMDGRARVPLRMEAFHGTDGTIAQYMNTGGWGDGHLIGWPDCKVFIPLDFTRTQFPGGYPNDNGINIMHDDFLGARQPETLALFELAARERPDLILNLHTGAGSENYYPRMLRPVTEDALTPVFNGLYRAVQTALARAGLQATSDPAVEADPAHAPKNGYNLDTALNFHCGALSVVVESPSHGYAGKNQQGLEVRQTADRLLDAELVVQEEALNYLADTGGRSRWADGK